MSALPGAFNDFKYTTVGISLCTINRSDARMFFRRHHSSGIFACKTLEVTGVYMVFLVGYFSPHVPFSLILFFFVDLDLDLLCIVYAGS